MSTLLSVLPRTQMDLKMEKLSVIECCCSGCCRLLSGSFCAQIRDVSRVDCFIKYSTLLDGIANLKKGTFFSIIKQKFGSV